MAQTPSISPIAAVIGALYRSQVCGIFVRNTAWSIRTNPEGGAALLIFRCFLINARHSDAGRQCYGGK